MSISIAIVEDLDVVRNGLKDFISLSTDFLVVGSFKTGEEALQKLPEIRPDIVIMDINLPGMNGIECIRQVKDKSPGTQFMMFTVYESGCIRLLIKKHRPVAHCRISKGVA